MKYLAQRCSLSLGEREGKKVGGIEEGWSWRWEGTVLSPGVHAAKRSPQSLSLCPTKHGFPLNQHSKQTFKKRGSYYQPTPRTNCFKITA